MILPIYVSNDDRVNSNNKMFKTLVTLLFKLLYTRITTDLKIAG